MRKIAILAWGSLLWEPRSLQKHIEPWQDDGPTLPLEFSRVSVVRANALTLVIDPELGTPISAYYAISRRDKLQTAIQDLAYREGCASKAIGWIDLWEERFCSRWDEVADEVFLWAEKKGIDAAIWTDLEPNFQDDSPKNALLYLQKLKAIGQVCAYEYIHKAPERVKTPFREFISKSAWYKQQRTAYAEKRSGRAYQGSGIRQGTRA